MWYIGLFILLLVQALWFMCIVVNRYRLWDKSGWLKITDRRHQFSNMLRFQVPLYGGSTFLFVDSWLIGALLPMMKAYKCSIASDSSWGALLWHCIAVAKCLVALMILLTGVTVAVFM